MDFKTVKDVSQYVIPIIDDFRKYQSHKEQSVKKLRIIFARESDYWKIVIDGGVFVATFKKDLGKTRRKFLKTLLYLLDYEWYKEIDFDVE